MAPPRYTTLHDYLRVIRERRLLIVLVALVVAGLAFANAARKDPVYAASASIRFNDITEDLALIGSSSGGSRQPAQDAAFNAEQVTRPPVAERAARQLRGAESPEALARRVGARIEAATGFVIVDARAPRAGEAAAIANAFADATVTQATETTRERFEIAARSLERQLRRLGRDRDSVNYAVLAQRQISLATLARLVEPAVITRAAASPRTPESPRPVRDTILGVAVGLSLGLLLAFLRDSLDVRLRRVEDIERHLDLPILARVRAGALGSTGLGGDSDAFTEPDAETFRMLRANVMFLDLRNPPAVVLVTSALPEEGKSTVASRLAATHAAAGKRTLLIECDLRRPVLTERLGLAPGPGLADHLAGSAEPAEVVRVVALPHMSSDGDGASAEPGEALPLAVVPAGRGTPRPAELLGSDRMGELLQEVRRVYDVVVLDSAPVLAVADPLELVPHADAVVLCVRTGSTTREQARSARAMLARGPAKPTGVVATGVKRGDETEYGDYYSAQYAVRSEPRATA